MTRSRFQQALQQCRWRPVRLAALERDGWKCRQCGCSPSRFNRLEVDHITPLQRGGEPYALRNLQTLCQRCHVKKTAIETGKAQVPGRADWKTMVLEMLQ